MIQSRPVFADSTKVTLHAFADESRRGDNYFIAAALVGPRDLSPLRKLLKGMRKPGQRELHFKKEDKTRRKEIVSRLVGSGAAVQIYVASCVRGEEVARRRCLVQLVEDLVDFGVGRLVLDSREVRDDADIQLFQRTLGAHRHHDLVYEHQDSCWEPLLWVADAVAWCYGAGGDWQRRVTPLVGKVIDLRDVP
ncbi:hypothetical protein JOD54_000950 [Actinokineospora baliensis]|uniref:hypothetical protein n=1 Tax=Actinokineospora baliensis TaxID=547056 RepID=UPI0027DC1C94|nr:hypothetical protein [Actinokineospora baliensis]MBM7770746.1 hypothetical protein [Actinokineospora baliensis]